MKLEVTSEEETKKLGEKFGKLLSGGYVIELVGDVGAGKTTFTKGLANGLGVSDDVQSPSYTINRTYQARDGITLSHYDFYRLNDAGILASELEELFLDNDTIVVIEWADIVEGVLPETRLTVHILATDENKRTFEFTARDSKSVKLLERLSA